MAGDGRVRAHWVKARHQFPTAGRRQAPPAGFADAFGAGGFAASTMALSRFVASASSPEIGTLFCTAALRAS